MASLPQQLNWDMAQNRWATILNPVIANPLTQGHMLSQVPLVIGTNIINHKLNRKLQGWFIVGINGVANIYDNQATNQMPQLTLSLTSDAAVTANIWVF